jgi:hypothetical protein
MERGVSFALSLAKELRSNLQQATLHDLGLPIAFLLALNASISASGHRQQRQRAEEDASSLRVQLVQEQRECELLQAQLENARATARQRALLGFVPASEMLDSLNAASSKNAFDNANAHRSHGIEHQNPQQQSLIGRLLQRQETSLDHTSDQLQQKRFVA